MDNYRIIGSCLEINAEIVSNRFNSKLPKFIANMQEKHLRNKLIKTVNKLRYSNTPLTKENLSEFFTYIYNNYPPHGNYKSVLMCQMIPNKDDTNDVEAVIKFDDYKAIISIDNSERSSEGFDIVVTNINESSNTEYTLHCLTLSSSKNTIKEHLEIINNRILYDITDYIIDILSSYNRKEK